MNFEQEVILLMIAAGLTAFFTAVMSVIGWLMLRLVRGFDDGLKKKVSVEVFDQLDQRVDRVEVKLDGHIEHAHGDA